MIDRLTEYLPSPISAKTYMLFILVGSSLVGLTNCAENTNEEQEQKKELILPADMDQKEKLRVLNLKMYQQYSYEEVNKIFAETDEKAPHYPKRGQMQGFASVEEQFEHWISNYPDRAVGYYQRGSI